MVTVAHGGLVLDELSALGLDAEDVLDFSVNVNPYGPCAEVRHAAATARMDRYPDPTAAVARSALGRWLDVSADQILVANGAVDVLWTVARALLAPGDTVLIAEPAFSEMRAAARRAGARVVECRARPAQDFAFDAARFSDLVVREAPRVAYLATPASPGGALVSAGTVRELAEAHPSTLMVVDTSFLALSTVPREDIVHASPRALFVRSLTKELSVPGLRIGFATGPLDLVAALHDARPPWSVSAPAEAVAVAATTTRVRDFVATSAAELLRNRAELVAGLRALGLRVHAGESTYALVDLGEARTGAALRRALLVRHGILVRDAASFGLPRHVRVAARPPRDIERLLTALTEELTQ